MNKRIQMYIRKFSYERKSLGMRIGNKSENKYNTRTIHEPMTIICESKQVECSTLYSRKDKNHEDSRK